MKRKVLMVLMGLSIGGAETHVVELSKELHRRGDEVVVVSAGGVYEQELLDAGIVCHHAPLTQRRILPMLRSYFCLRRILRQEKPDVVHAHARIPAFLCGILTRRRHIPFVTTAHWVFYVNPLLRRLTNWGEQTVAVSEDIRTYLKENYALPDRQIRVTINGIDMEKFSPEVSGAAIRQEFGIAPEQPTVVYVSRMDESRALAARHLIAAAPRLKADVPNLRILIVGGGDVFDEVRACAEEANRAAGERYIEMTGARTDIGELVAAGDVFVGVSRAALEAMSAGKPVIVAGNEGYLGLFEESRLAEAQENNFCCRGCPESSPERLYEDLSRVLCGMSREERAALGLSGRSVIQRCYSVGRMADDCACAYERAILSHLRVALSGYYGFRNLGDDSILLFLRDGLARIAPGAKLVALSDRPRETRKCCGVDAVYRFRPLAVWRTLRRSDCLLSGGGSLLQDHTSTRSLLYYTFVIRMAKRLHKPVMFYANGIGPVHDEANRRRVCRAAEEADVITLRDEASREELIAMGVAEEKLRVTADPVYRMEGVGREEARAFLAAQGIPLDRPILGVSVRFARGMETDTAEFARFCDAAAESMTVVFLAMQLPDDAAASEAVQAKMRHKAYVLRAPYDPGHMMGAIACMDAVVSTRLHSLIFAACGCVPLLGVVYDPKVEACLDTLGMPAAGTLEGFRAEKASEALRELLENREAYRALLRERTETLRERAGENETALAALLRLSDDAE